MADQTPPLGWLQRHEFLIRRLHSLSGLIPVGAYMCVHLMTNASINNGPATFQKAVYQIHSLGRLLPLVEWGLIFLPILFHAVIGVVIVAGGLPNTANYPFKSNIRYTLQRATGMIAFFFIVYHVFHMHGWFHFDAWAENVAGPLGGAQFAPYNAASTLGAALSGWVIRIVYLVGLLSCVYHLANGLWTMGITWGVWTSPKAQARANIVCGLFGVALTAVSLGAWVGAMNVDTKKARSIEEKMFRARVTAGELDPEEAEHKRAHRPIEASDEESEDNAKTTAPH